MFSTKTVNQWSALLLEIPNHWPPNSIKEDIFEFMVNVGIISCQCTEIIQIPIDTIGHPHKTDADSTSTTEKDSSINAKQ